MWNNLTVSVTLWVTMGHIQSRYLYLSPCVCLCRTPCCLLSSTSLGLSDLQMWSLKTTPKESNQHHLTPALIHLKCEPNSGLSVRGTRWICTQKSFLNFLNLQLFKDKISTAFTLSALVFFHLTVWNVCLSFPLYMAWLIWVNKLLTNYPWPF